MKETSIAFRAFERYYDLGDGRTLEKLAYQIQADQKQTKSRPKEQTIPTILAQLKKWSVAHGWQDRIIERDRAEAEKEREKRNKAIQAMNERHALIGTTQQARAIEQIKTLIDAKSFGSMAAVQLLKLAIETERLARGVPTEQVAVTGKDGEPVDVIVQTFWGRGTDPRKRSEDDANKEEAMQEPEISVEFGNAEEGTSDESI